MSETALPADSLSEAAESSSQPATGNVLLPAWTLASREVVRFFRQRSRVIGAIGQPFIFWILFGAGLGGAFAAPEWAREMSYQEFFFSGIAILIVLFTAIFSTFSTIQDRNEGFLQSVLASPAPRSSLVFGKLAGGTFLALLQAGVFLLIGPVLAAMGVVAAMNLEVGFLDGIGIALFLTLVAFGLVAMGHCIGWRMDSIQGFHAIMMVLLFPMWLLSGAFFPVPAVDQSAWLHWLMTLNPLTYAVAGLRHLLAAQPLGDAVPSFVVCLSICLLFAGAFFTLAVMVTRRRISTDAR